DIGRPKTFSDHDDREQRAPIVDIPLPPPPPSSSLDAYLASISPPRELICPITQELLRDPVVAEDGHTYERKSLTTWFGMGRDRSPVTNSLLDTSSEGDGIGGGAAGGAGSGGRNMVPNLAVSSMANAHRERLGRELVFLCGGRRGRRSRRIRSGAIGRDVEDDDDDEEEEDAMVGGGLARCDNGENDNDDDRIVGAMIEGLLDAGADPNGRDETSNTPLHLLIRTGNIRLAYRLLEHDASVTLTNDAGLDCIATAEEELATRRTRQRRPMSLEVGGGRTSPPIDLSQWTDFVSELKRREVLERARSEARDLARSRANDEHRERQRALAANARSNANDNNNRGLGRLEDGVGYFPSLATLQFQSSIPGPSPSVAEFEGREKERLNRILRGMGILVLVYFLIS
ncbi:hypothetical protein ACHAXA_008439, partial [Cyclostephanos tholiformis]